MAARAAGLPLPHLTVRGITIGTTEDIKVGKVTVTPDLWTLFDPTRVIKSIEIDGLVITHKAVGRIPAWLPLDARAGEPSQPPALRLEAIKLDDAVIQLQKATIGPFDAGLNLAHDGGLESASIINRDGALKVLVKPQQSSYLADISAQLYGCAVTGRLVLGWQKGVQLKGSASVSSVEIAPLLRELDKPQNMSGRINARPVFSAQAATPEQILDALRLDTPFGVDDGVLHGVDIRKAATFTGQDGGAGGETRFDKLRGQLNIDRGTRRLTRLDIVSGPLSADGNVTISPQDELSGRINTSIKAASVAAVSAALNVSGTLDSPQLFPSGGTMAGAAAGTAVLGPVFGTAVGARVGQWVEGLFGKKSE